MKIKDDATASTDDFWYDMTEERLKPDEICADPADAKRITEAIAVIREFEQSCEAQITDFYR